MKQTMSAIKTKSNKGIYFVENGLNNSIVINSKQMKRIAFLLLIVSAAFTVNAQTEKEQNQDSAKQENTDEPKTLFGSVNSHGGYGAMNFRYTDIAGKDGIMIGGRGGWIIDHKFVLGLSGTGIISNVYYDDFFNKNVMLTGGYGGFLFEPILLYKSPIHLSLPITIGGGGIAISPDYINYDNNNQYGDEYYNYYEDAAAYFVVEPGVEVELSLFKYMRVGFGAYYRVTTDVDIINMKKDFMTGFSAGMTVKFGVF